MKSKIFNGKILFIALINLALIGWVFNVATINPVFASCADAWCGNGSCESSCGENSLNCSYDCGSSSTVSTTYAGTYFESTYDDSWCGNGVCESGETSSNCSYDCGSSYSPVSYSPTYSYPSYSSCSSCSSYPSCSSCSSCPTQCNNLCSYDGEARCVDEDHYQVCGDYNYDSCLEWSDYGHCGWGEVCVDGECVPDCDSHYTKKCYDNDVYWYDSCGNQEDKYKECGEDSWGDEFKCSGDWVLREKILRGCSCHSCFNKFEWENYENCAAKNKICKDGACVDKPTLSVSLQAVPSSGSVPLNDVDLIATVSGTATGKIKYKFDCTSNGTWEKTISIDSNPYTAADLCDYSQAGTYTAKVYVEREGLTAEAITQIVVTSPSQPVIIPTESPNPISPSLSVSLVANPSSGIAPLEDVDLLATVSGTATGKIKYKFDCTSNGTWEKTISSDSTSYTAVNLCDYTSPANYTATVVVERENLTATASTQIDVSSPINHPPIADAGPDRTIEEGKSMKIYGSGSDPDGDKVTYSWYCSGGSITNTTSKTLTFYAPKNPSDYNYYCNLTVTDEKGLTASDRMLVTITKPNVPVEKTSVSVVKTGKNTTKGDSQFSDTIAASPGDELQFKIAITNTGKSVAKNITIQDIFPQGISYNGYLMVNGVATSAEIWGGLKIGDIPVGYTKIITFNAKVGGPENFDYGVNSLVNSAVASGDNIDGIKGDATINVRRAEVAGATTINTGAKPISLIFIVSSLVFILLIIFNFLNDYLMARSKTWREIMWRIKIFKSFIFSE